MNQCMAAKLCDRKTFCGKHSFGDGQIDKCELDWAELEKIHDKHSESVSDLHNAAGYILERLRQIKQVHSVRLRIKDPEHLVAKIIRKKIENPKRDLTPDNYSAEITDLIGIRALHLFKDDWLQIHDFVNGNWNLAEKPKAYFRKGDPEHLLELFRARGCETAEHEFGYRSVHYLVKTQPAKTEYTAELQVRTLFEEAWSEIDHQIRYPQHSSDAQLAEFLTIFNRLAGSADEMGTFIKKLALSKEEIEARFADTKRTLEAKEHEIQAAISKLNISDKERKKLEREIEELRQSSRSHLDNVYLSPAQTGAFLNPTSMFAPVTIASLGIAPRCRRCGTNLPSNSINLDGVCDSCRVTSIAAVTMGRSCISCGKGLPSATTAIFTTESYCDDCRRSRIGGF
jgi:putative GTP pyrophosphokinase